MPYREDLDAAQARVETLERELAELRASPSTADVAALKEIVELRTANHELQLALYRANEELARPRIVEVATPAAKKTAQVIAELEAEIAALREAARARDAELAREAARPPANASTAIVRRPRDAGFSLGALIAGIAIAIAALASHWG